MKGQTKSKWKCVREDGRDLVEEWKNNKRKAGAKHAFVDTKKSLRDINPGNIDYLLGSFPLILIIIYFLNFIYNLLITNIDSRVDNLYSRHFLQLPS